jgi:hypothetical protein
VAARFRLSRANPATGGGGRVGRLACANLVERATKYTHLYDRERAEDPIRRAMGSTVR